MRHGIARRLRERVHALLELALAHTGVREVSGHALVLLGHVSALLAHGRELHAHLGEARDHVLALLLQKAHVGVHTAENVLHAATLLAKVAHKEALLLEKRLVLLEFGGLLVQAILGELDGGIGLTAARRERAIGCLQAAQVVNGELLAQRGQALGDVMGALGLINLPLKRLELAVDLACHNLGARQVVVHRGELAETPLLAPAVLGDVGSLFDELAALLGAALENGVELALADDRVGILAQAGVMEDVLHIHETRGRAVDEVLGLTRAIHPARDANLGKVDGQRVVGVVEHQRDLRHAHGGPSRASREDHVLHGLAAQHLSALLAQDPEDGVRDVRLARAVWAHDHVETGVKGHGGPVGEGLEALEGERLQIQGWSSRFSG